MIEDDALVELIKRVEAAETEMLNAGESRAATFFEFTTALAFEHFKRSGVDLAVLETGLGGRLDATNVVTPLVSIITSIGVDHAGYLGHDLRQVAAEKGGIIKPGRPVLCGAREPEAREVIFAIARERGSNLVVVAEVASVRRLGQSLTAQRVKLETSSMSYPPVSLPLVGEHQLENGAIAVAAAEYLSQAGVLDIGQEAIYRGLERVVWPGRFQLLSEDPVLVLDAAHNPSGAHVLLRTLKEVAGDVPLGLLASFSSEKDSYGFFSVFAGSVERTWLVPLENERGMPMEKMEADAVAAGLRPVTSSRRDALAEATAWAREVKGVVCIAGSIYLVGEVLEGRECGPV